MSGFQFEEDNKYGSPKTAYKKPIFTRWLIATGIISTDKQAEYVLLAVSAVAIIISAFIFFNMTNSNTGAKPSAALMEQLKQAQANNR